MAHLPPNAWQCAAQDDPSANFCCGMGYSNHTYLKICAQTLVYLGAHSKMRLADQLLVGINNILLTVTGFVVGLALSFRSSTAYER